MKFSAALSVLFAGSAVVEAMTIRGNSKSASTLMQKARRVQDNQQYYYYNGGQADNANMYYGNGQGQNYYADMDDESMWFLQGYSIYLLSCIEGQQVMNYQDQEKSVEGSTVIFRLCPVDTCDAESSEFGCQEGYGDFAVGINTFVSAYLESQQELYGKELVYYSQTGKEFVVNDYAGCGEYNFQENQGGQGQGGYYQYQQYGQNGQYYGQYNGQYNGQQQGNNGYQQQQQNGNGYYQQQGNNGYQNGYQQGGYEQMEQYNANSQAEQYYYNAGNRKLQNNYNQWYIGPGCTSDGKDIRLGLYRDQYCTYSPGTKLQDITYGWSNGMPFEDGGLIPNTCHHCTIRDQDYNLKINGFCSDPFRAAMTRCELNMTAYSYMGPNTNGCDYITNLEYSIFGDAIYGVNVTDSASNSTGTFSGAAWEETALRFMDRMNTRQTRAFIAAMVLFCVSACIGASLITCMCFKKRRARKRAKALVANEDVYQGGNPIPMEKQQSGFVDLVRSSSKRMKDAVASVATGTKVVVATAAAGAVAAVTRSSSKKVTVESSEYTNMEDNIEKPTEGTYTAPDAVASASVKSKESTATERTAVSEKANDKPVPTEISTEKKEEEKPTTASTGGVLQWFGLSKSAEKAEENETEKEQSLNKLAKEQYEASDSHSAPSVAASSQKDLTSQMDDYFSEKFT
jgi:hypothetical protein